VQALLLGLSKENKESQAKRSRGLAKVLSDEARENAVELSSRQFDGVPPYWQLATRDVTDKSVHGRKKVLSFKVQNTIWKKEIKSYFIIIFGYHVYLDFN